MNILAVMGSPRKNGNTSLLLKQYLKGVAKNHEDVKIETIYLQEKNISPCIECYKCIETGKCSLKDDMQPIYEKVKKADVLVFATPIFWWSISAQLKIFMDRLYALDVEKTYKNKRFVLLMTFGGHLPNKGPKFVENTMREICEYLNMKFTQVYATCTDENIPVAENEEVLSQIYELGERL